jgi:nucleotide-binding universal stress UspA family protein
MYRSLMLPLDGSPFSEQALPVATTLAGLCGAELRIIHVHEPFIEADMDLVTPFRYEGLEQAERGWESDEVRLEEEFLSKHMGQHCKVVEGSVVPMLEQEIADTDPDLIVMATHGRGGLSRAWLGSVADTLIRDIHKPILLIRTRESDHEPHTLRTDHLLVPLDGSALAESVIKHALAIAQPATTRITLLRVVAPAYVASEFHALVPSDNLLNERVAAAHDYLNHTASQLGVEGYLVDTDVVVSGAPGSAILDYSRRYEADVICMATHGRSGVKRWLLGSVADKVLRGADQPVLLYRP